MPRIRLRLQREKRAWFRFHPSRSVISKILLFFFVGTVIIALGVGLSSFSISKSVIQDKVADTSEQSVMQSAKLLDLALRSYIDLTLHMVEDLDLFPQFAKTLASTGSAEVRVSRLQALQKLSQYQAATVAVNALHILPVDGSPGLSTNGDGVFAGDYVREDWFQTIVHGSRGGEWLDTRVSGYSGRFTNNSMAYGRVVYDSLNNEPENVILVEIDVFLALSRHIPLDSGGSGRMLIVNESNQVVLSQDRIEIGLNSGIAFDKPLGEYESDRPVRLTQDEGDGRHLIILQRSALTGWYLIASYSVNELVKETGEIYKVTLVSILGAAAAAALLAYLLVLTIGRPLIHLSKLMKEGEMGNLMVRARIRRQDEIGQLSRHFNQMMDRVEHLIESEYKSHIIGKEAQIRALQGQINPHFLYNTLQTMGSIAQVNDVPEIKIMCKSLSNMFRYSIKMKEEWVPIREEIMHVRNYLVIINKRYGDSMRVRIRVEPGLEECLIPRLIIQPLVENAIEHGLIPSRRQRKLVKVGIAARGGELFIEIVDNGVGLAPEQVEGLQRQLASINAIYESYKRDHSIGVLNVQTRILLLCGEPYGIRLGSRKSVGTRIVIGLPVKTGGEADV